MSNCMCFIYAHIELFLFRLYNVFTVTQLTRDKLGVHQSGMWFQYEHRLQALSWTASFQRQVDLMQSRYCQRPCYSQVSLVEKGEKRRDDGEKYWRGYYELGKHTLWLQLNTNEQNGGLVLNRRFAM